MIGKEVKEREAKTSFPLAGKLAFSHIHKKQHGFIHLDTKHHIDISRLFATMSHGAKILKLAFLRTWLIAVRLVVVGHAFLLSHALSIVGCTVPSRMVISDNNIGQKPFVMEP
jgi:hypothetical protein